MPLSGMKSRSTIGSVILGRVDDIDRQIVALLRQDARRSFQSIGVRVSLSAPAVKRRVDRLEADGEPVRRYDLSRPAAKVIVEYDGRHHIERVEQWEDDHLGVLRLVGTALAPVGDAAVAALRDGDPERADRWVQAGEGLVFIARSAVEVYEATYGKTMGVEATAWESRVAAEAARLRGNTAPELWRAAVEAFGFGHVFEAARSRWRLAEALLTTGDRVGAAEEAKAAHEVAVRLTDQKTVVHPRVGSIRVDCETLVTPDQGQRLVVLTPADADAREGLELLRVLGTEEFPASVR